VGGAAHPFAWCCDSDTKAEFDLNSQEDKNWNLFLEAASGLCWAQNNSLEDWLQNCKLDLGTFEVQMTKKKNYLGAFP